MSYFLTEEQELIRKVAKQFTEEEVRPRASDVYGPNSAEYFKEFGKRMSELGFFLAPVPESLGGLGAPVSTLLIIEEEIAKESAALALHIMVTTNDALALWLMPEAAKKWFPKVISGESIIAGSMADPKGLTNFSEWDDFAVLDGEDYVLNGSRNFSTGAPYADVVVFWGLYKSNMMGFVVEAGTPGFTVTKDKKMGLGTHFGALSLKNVRVNKAYTGNFEMIVKDKEIQESCLGSSTTLQMSVQQLGLAEGVLAKTIEYLKARTIGYQPAASRQDLQVKITKMQSKIELLRALIYNSARAIDEGKPIPMLAHMSKVFGDEVGVETARQCMQLYGGLGYCVDTGIERYMRDALGLSIGCGTADQHRSTIAYLLGLPGSKIGTF